MRRPTARRPHRAERKGRFIYCPHLYTGRWSCAEQRLYRAPRSRWNHLGWDCERRPEQIDWRQIYELFGFQWTLIKCCQFDSRGLRRDNMVGYPSWSSFVREWTLDESHIS